MDESFDYIRLKLFGTFHNAKKIKPLTVGQLEGITPTEATAIHMIGIAGTYSDAPARPGELACNMHVSPSALSQILKSLEAKGFLERGRMSGDYRAVTLSLTEAGGALFEEIDMRWTEQMLSMVDYVGIDEFLSMLKGVKRVTEFSVKVRAGEIDMAVNERNMDSPHVKAMIAKLGEAVSQSGFDLLDDDACGTWPPVPCDAAGTPLPCDEFGVPYIPALKTDASSGTDQIPPSKTATDMDPIPDAAGTTVAADANPASFEPNEEGGNPCA